MLNILREKQKLKNVNVTNLFDLVNIVKIGMEELTDLYKYFTTNLLDLATAIFPKLLTSRFGCSNFPNICLQNLIF